MTVDTHPRRFLVLLLAMFLGICHARAAEAVSIAAAANFTYALEALNAEFQHAAPHVRVTTALGASGNLYAQIRNGAPFDVFLSADAEYPQQLARDGAANPATLTAFAAGRLVLWTTRQDVPLSDVTSAVRSPRVARLAIAQPRTAPYGLAAQAALTKLGLWAEIAPRLVVGENISQTAQFVETGNADAGFVAQSLVVSSRLAHQGRWIVVPPELYAPVTLEHVCILTRRGAQNPAARRYVEFLRGDAAKRILERFGYDVPAPKPENAGATAK